MNAQSPSTWICANWPQNGIENNLLLLPRALSSLSLEKCNHLDHTTGKRNIYKFGGTSVGSPLRLYGLVDIIQKERSRVLAVVVSAMGDTTDWLIEAVEYAASGDQTNAMKVVDRIQELAIHNTYDTEKLLLEKLPFTESLANPNALEGMAKTIEEVLHPLSQLLYGISLLGEKTNAAMDNVLSYGERLSAMIVAKLLERIGIEAFYVDARTWLSTDDCYSCAKVDFEVSQRNLQELATTWNGRLPIITGFIGKATNGRTTTLGRNGSDYTATIVGASLKADYVVINTDISGVMTADPRIVDQAVSLSHLNHHEALELAVYGTRMFHARTMVPLIQGGVTMLIRNTMDPNGHGTYISNLENSGKTETCTTSLENLSIIEVRTRILQDGSPISHAENIGARITKLLESLKIPVWLSIRGAHGQAISVVIPQDKEEFAITSINDELSADIASKEIDPLNSYSPVTMVSIVAEDFSKVPFNQTKFFSALSNANIEVLAVGQGTSSRSLSCIIHGRDTKVAVRRVHDAFNVDYNVASIVLLGCNRISLEVLRQLQLQKDLFLYKHKVDIKIVGFGSNCCEFMYNPKGFSIHELVQIIEGCKSTRRVFNKTNSRTSTKYNGAPTKQQLDVLQDQPIPILVDCSAQKNHLDLYLACIDRGIHVVISNAHSMIGLPPTASRESVATERKHGLAFLMYTSTIGASLPVIDTIGNLLRTGDQLLQVETSLSGSMGYLANEIMSGKPLSIAIREVLSKGFCEQDPRVDFTGQDVAAKITVLARSLGLTLDSRMIETEPFIPLEILDNIKWRSDIEIDEIVDYVSQFDTEFSERFYKPAIANNQRLRYIASIDLSNSPTSLKVHIRPVLVTEDHPAFYVKGEEIVFGFKTAQNHHTPIVLKGTGTGPVASATGVLRDVCTVLRGLRGNGF